jgi:hypothetical protein
MCRELAELARALAAYGADFDASLVTAADARAVANQAARIERVASAIKALAEARPPASRTAAAPSLP